MVVPSAAARKLSDADVADQSTPTASAVASSFTAAAAVAAALDVGASASLALELYRPLRPGESSWHMGSRGVVLRLRKRAQMHWPRLLRSATADGKQGIDWSRWEHPLAEAAEQEESKREKFQRLNSARAREMRELRPRFDEALRSFAAARERDEALDPRDATHMIRMGEAILTHFREERKQREELLGDPPLPAGVDEEQLERSLLKLQEMERKGTIKYDRNTASWKEWRRRQKERASRRKAGEAITDWTETRYDPAH